MGIFSNLSVVSRRRKLALFNDLMKPTESMRILDVGAQVARPGAQDVQFIDSYPWKHRISAINIQPDHVHRVKACYPEVDAKVGDACQLPWEDKCFDIVYSNAVIEHVGSSVNQRRMAEEIMRVGRRWFVTTPNRWYPFEFHLRLPFVTWLPFQGYRGFSRLIRYNHVQRRYVLGGGPTEVRLLSASDLREYFPSSRIVKQRVTFMAETLIVVGGST